MNDGGGGGERRSFRSNFRAITRLETLATQASDIAIYNKKPNCLIEHRYLYIELAKTSAVGLLF